MITYFVRQFLGGRLRQLRRCPPCSSPQPRAGPTGSNVPVCLFELPSAPARYLFLRTDVDALKTRRENGPAVSKRALRVGGRSMRPAAPICAFDRRLGNAPEWARAEGF